VARITLFNPQNPVKPGAVLKLLAVLVLFIFFFISFLQRNVDNNDFWWHLATGKYITETGSLPHEDPFSYTTHTAPSDRKSIILKGYWLAQVIFYKTYSFGDFRAIAVLRSLLMLFFLFFVFLNVRKQTSSDLLSLAFVSVIFLIAVPYSADRPQLFTFLIFSMVYYLLEDFRAKISGKIFLIPVLVMILANMHPGYIVCLLLISIYLFAFGIRHFIVKDHQEKGSQFRRLLMVWILSILTATLNPAGMGEFKEILHVGEYTQGIVEFMPTFYLFAKKLTPLNYPYIIFLTLSFLAVLEFRKIGLTHILLLLFFSVMSFVSIRYVIFFMCVSAPIIAKTAIILSEKKVFAKPVSTVTKRKTFFYFVSFLIAVFLAFNSLSGLASHEVKADFLSAAPEGAADFLGKLPVKGNMLNDYGFGGYLIWRLYPEKKVFIDGRTLEADVYNEYQTVTLTKRHQPQSWEDIIKKHDISYVVVPPLLYYGQIYPLVEKLYDSTEWELIYKDNVSLVFLKNDSRNISLVKRYAMDKKEVLNAIIIQALANADSDRTNPYYLISLGKAFMKMGKRDNAEKAFLSAYKRDPQNPETNRWIQKLRDRR
jgi:hypothetical protein